MKFFTQFGAYILLLRSLFKKPENYHVYWKELFRQMVAIGVGSVVIVIIVSVFMGAVFTVQSAYQLVSSFIPKSVIGSIVSDSTILELAPSITALVLAGKIGSSIASEMGTMRVTEQIDALEIMGVNASGFLIGPKILAALITIPMLNVFSIALCIGGGVVTGELSGILSANEFLDGALETFIPFNILFSMIKAFTFAFLITSIAAYQGFYIKGGAREVGIASTKAVVYSCVAILFTDYLLTELLLP